MAEPDPRRRAILDSAGRLFAERGVKRTTTRAIAEEAGIVSGSLYHYYPHKSLILQELLRENFEDLLAAYAEAVSGSKSPTEELRALIRASLEVAHRHPHTNEVYQVEHSGLAQGEGFEFLSQASVQIQAVWLKTIERGIEEGAFQPGIPAGVVYRLIRDAVWLAIRWMDSTDEAEFEARVDQCEQLFLHGIAVPATAGS